MLQVSLIYVFICNLFSFPKREYVQ
uniref:Uncharacterized protein n=1 Tax=Arundo donax TaxID=35708 RepID=A0A0A9HWU5_ARUDO